MSINVRMHEQIVFVHTMECDIAIKINDLLRHTARWINVIIIMLSERNPTKK